MNVTNQLKTNNQRVVLPELESCLISFMTTFKSHILTEPRMVMLGQSMIEEPDENAVLDSLDGVYNESAQAMDKIA